jgi:hypothetical protein
MKLRIMFIGFLELQLHISEVHVNFLSMFVQTWNIGMFGHVNLGINFWCE